MIKPQVISTYPSPVPIDIDLVVLLAGENKIPLPIMSQVTGSSIISEPGPVIVPSLVLSLHFQ